MNSQRSKEKMEHANQIREDIIDGYRVMIILRGLPGSGKSSMAKDFCALTLNSEPKNFIFSTDDYFLNNKSGRYLFDPSHLQKAHSWNQMRVESKAKTGWSPIFVDNTHTQVWEMLPYIKIAVANGYIVKLLEPDTPWMRNPVFCANHNVHNVPLNTIQNMHERYEKADIKAIFESCNIRYTRNSKPPQDSCTKYLLKTYNEPKNEFVGVTSESVTTYNSIIQPATNEEDKEDNACGPLVSSDYISVQSVSTSKNNEIERDSSIRNSDILTPISRFREVNFNENHSGKKPILPRLEMVNNSVYGYFVKTTWETLEDAQGLDTVCSAEANYSDWDEPNDMSEDEPSTSTIHQKQKPEEALRVQRKNPETVNLDSSEGGIKQVQYVDKGLESFVSEDEANSSLQLMLGIQCIEKLKSLFSVSTAISKQTVSVVTVPFIMALQLYSHLEESEFRQWQQEQEEILKHDEFLAYLLQDMGNDIDDTFDLSRLTKEELSEAMKAFLSNQNKRCTYDKNCTLTSSEKDDHFIDVDVGFQCATQLKCLFDSDYDISNLYSPMIRLPYHLALQLHLLWEHSMHEQWRFEQYEIVKTDEQMARDLQNEENKFTLDKEIKANKEEPFQKVTRVPKNYKGVNINPDLPVDSQTMLLMAHLEHHNKGVANIERRIALYNELSRYSNSHSAIRLRDVLEECEFTIQQEFSLSAGNFVDYTIKSRTPQQIDLHLLFLVEATFAVNMFLDQHIMRLRVSGQVEITLEFITGQGLHSRHGKPRIRPAVQQILKQRQLTSQTVYNNNGVLTAKVFVNSLLNDEIC